MSAENTFSGSNVCYSRAKLLKYVESMTLPQYKPRQGKLGRGLDRLVSMRLISRMFGLICGSSRRHSNAMCMHLLILSKEHGSLSLASFISDSLSSFKYSST